MTISELVLSAVVSRLRSEGLPGIKSRQIDILPEGKVPASVGQKFITVYPETIISIGNNTQWPAKQLSFGVAVIQRIRDIPNDRFGIIYTDPIGMAALHETITNIIASIEMLDFLVSESDGIYSISKNFRHQRTSLDPFHLYPGFFYTPAKTRASDGEDGLDTKIAGFKTVSYFNSPLIRLNDNPLICDGESSSS